jgi:16S rRNA (adenine1518-N6/adenine1519-N6)-dimethyltransferase
VVKLDFTAPPALDLPDEEHHRSVVHAAFGQRRKTLRNALRAIYNSDAVAAALAATGLDGGRRGETLSLVEFAALSRAIPASSQTGIIVEEP